MLRWLAEPEVQALVVIALGVGTSFGLGILSLLRGSRERALEQELDVARRALARRASVDPNDIEGD